MFNPLTLDAPYDELQLINLLPGYDASQGTDELLDLVRMIQTSGNYFWQGNVFPGANDISVAAKATVNGTIQVPPGTYITSIQYYDSDDAGFKFKLYDKGTKASIFYGDYALERTIASNMQLGYGVGHNNPPTDAGSNLDNPFGPGYLMSPFIVTPPGILGWEIVNLSASAATLQVLLCCAVPLTNRSINTTVVDKKVA